MSVRFTTLCRRAALRGLTVIVSGLAITGCSSDSTTGAEAKSDVLVRVGAQSLTAGDMAKVVPAGLSSEDSVKFVKAYITKWVDENLVSEIASRQVDQERIKALVDEYRRELILREYTEQQFRNEAAEIPEDTLRTFYDSNKALFTLSQPMVRGTYIKIDASAPNLKKIRRLYASNKPEDADLLEKELLSDAIHYDYFRDKWIPWEQIESRIPYDFGTNSHSWAAKGRSLDFTQNGHTYLLYISEVLPAGSTTPFEAARADIYTRMLNARRSEYQATLLRDLLQRAVADGNAEINI